MAKYRISPPDQGGFTILEGGGTHGGNNLHSFVNSFTRHECLP